MNAKSPVARATSVLADASLSESLKLSLQGVDALKKLAEQIMSQVRRFVTQSGLNPGLAFRYGAPGRKSFSPDTKSRAS